MALTVEQMLQKTGLNLDPGTWVKETVSGAAKNTSLAGLFPDFRNKVLVLLCAAIDAGYKMNTDMFIGDAGRMKGKGASRHYYGMAVDIHCPNPLAMFAVIGPMAVDQLGLRWGHVSFKYGVDIHCTWGGVRPPYYINEQNVGKVLPYRRANRETTKYKLGDWEHIDGHNTGPAGWSMPVSLADFQKMGKWDAAVPDVSFSGVPAGTSVAGNQQLIDPATLEISAITQEYLKDFLDFEYLVRRYGERSGQISVPFNPNLMVGFPIQIKARFNTLAGVDTQNGLVTLIGYVVSLDHHISVDPPMAMTQIGLSMLRTIEEDTLLKNEYMTQFISGQMDVNIYNMLGLNQSERKHATMADIERIYQNVGAKKPGEKLTQTTQDIFDQYFGKLPGQATSIKETSAQAGSLKPEIDPEDQNDEFESDQEQPDNLTRSW